MAIDCLTAFDPNTELLGIIIISYVQSMWADDIAPLIKEHGYDNVDPNGWYNLQEWLDFMTLIYDMPDGPTRMVSLGMKIGEAMPFPPEITSLEQIMEGAAASTESVHRNGAWGSIVCEKLSSRHLRLHNHTPYTDESVYGTYYAFAKRFLPRGSDFTVTSSQNRSKRYPAIDEPPLTIDVRWK